MEKMIEVRRLNSAGIHKFAQTNWTTCSLIEGTPSDIILDDSFSEIISFPDNQPRFIDMNSSFEKKIELAEIIDNCLHDVEFEEMFEKEYLGMWAWFSLLFYDNLRGKNKDGGWKGAEQARYTGSHQSNKYYRHSVAGPYFLYKYHGKQNTDIFLDYTSKKLGEMMEQLASTSEIVTNRNFIEAANKLYHNKDKKKGKMIYKKGAGAKHGGGARRLVVAYNQLILTYNLDSMSADQIISILPSEFDKFKEE
jgi:hypothetical protein